MAAYLLYSKKESDNVSIWFLLWLFLSLTLLYFFGWTLLILYKQKRAWKLFAKKRDLRYEGGKFSDAPSMAGDIEGYEFSFFPAQYEIGDIRHNRKMTAIEVTLKNKPPFEGFVASGLLVETIKLAELPHEFTPEHEKWKGDSLVVTDNVAAMSSYLTSDRQEVVTRWMLKNNIWFLIGFRNDVYVLRIDTPLPMDNPKKINALVKMILKDIPSFEVSDNENVRLQIAVSRDSSAAVSSVKPQIELSGDDISVDLELETDDSDSPAKE